MLFAWIEVGNKSSQYYNYVCGSKLKDLYYNYFFKIRKMMLYICKRGTKGT